MARERSYNEQLVLDNINFYDYYNDFVVPLNKTKQDQVHLYEPMGPSKNIGLCPFHVDTDASLHWWRKHNVFHCFGCRYSGDLIYTHIRLTKMYRGASISVEKAVEELATKYGITLNKETGHIVKSPFERARELLFDRSSYVIPKDVFTIAEFRKLNKKVISSDLPMNIKVANFAHLDAVASVSLSNRTE